MATDDDLSQFIEGLRQEFIEITSERLTTVDDLITQMMDPDDGYNAAMLEFQRHIHSIKGTGVTFDFPTVSTIAHRLEDYVETASELAAAQFRDVQVYVDAIRTIVESGTDPDETSRDGMLAGLPITVNAEPEKVPAGEVHILLVFPRGMQRNIIGKELATGGFFVTLADTPVDAIGLAIAHAPDIVVTTRIMDQMRGEELAHVLHTIDTTRHCRVVIATSSDEGNLGVDGLPDTATIVGKGRNFSADLGGLIEEWGFFD